jgi:hypothetical protein
LSVTVYGSIAAAAVLMLPHSLLELQQLLVGWWPATLHFLVSCMSAMNPSSASLLRIPALLLYKDELLVTAQLHSTALC